LRHWSASYRRAKEAAQEERNRDRPLPLTARLLAERLAELPTCLEADSTAHFDLSDFFGLPSLNVVSASSPAPPSEPKDASLEALLG
jgi:hypothetical protein